MKTIIIKVLQGIIYRTSLQNYIIRLHQQDLLKKNAQQVIGSDYTFYPETIISNMQNNPANIVIGINTHVRGTLLIFKYGGKITIGNNCYIGDGSKIWSGENITIGNDVLIAHSVNIVDTQAHEIDSTQRSERYLDLLKQGPWKDKGSIETKAITIHNKAWISFNAIILKGVTIGEGAIVAAGSVVTKDVAPYTLVAGNPAVFVKKVK
jgi:acetyltransferase-like isoleucine patch superfamily enzyme